MWAWGITPRHTGHYIAIVCVTERRLIELIRAGVISYRVYDMQHEKRFERLLLGRGCFLGRSCRLFGRCFLCRSRQPGKGIRIQVDSRGHGAGLLEHFGHFVA